MFNRERTSPILVSEKIDLPLIDVITLEILRLKVDPTTGKVEKTPFPSAFSREPTCALKGGGFSEQKFLSQ